MLLSIPTKARLKSKPINAAMVQQDRCLVTPVLPDPSMYMLGSAAVAAALQFLPQDALRAEFFEKNGVFSPYAREKLP